MLKNLSRIEFGIAASLLAIIVVLVFLAAIMRFFGHPLIWSVDLAQLLFIWLCFLGATRAMREKGHIGIDLLVRQLGNRSRFALETAITIVILVFLGLLAYEGYELTMLNRQRQFGDSGLSYAWVTAAVPVGCLMLAGALIWNLVQAWRNRREGLLVYSRISDGTASASEL
ncbi:TRAP-type C4-dicarboxylate transport system permease small subunit [Mesorhizobium sp. J18]|uniref:TRAP transporter small permease n=1 Tax=Mesorhizobium sp. J18 TaxID=935263 RepID=UPI001199F8AE|nr:TRAP transporter small permease [Mesorhizobium sp. J18]TWG94817.1 TRAP-type C4-dicarboxylate transport system permease small subunit [Mesorhizobium sp. J18]